MKGAPWAETSAQSTWDAGLAGSLTGLADVRLDVTLRITFGLAVAAPAGVTMGITFDLPAETEFGLAPRHPSHQRARRSERSAARNAHRPRSGLRSAAGPIAPPPH
jgi:hypothetical protein